MGVGVTAPRRYEEAQGRVGKEDEVLKSFEVLGGTFGHLLISKQRVISVHGNGLFNKAVKCDLDLPCNRVGKVTHLDDRVFDITVKLGRARTSELLREHLEPIPKEDEFDSP